MPRIVFRTPQGQETELDVASGQSVLDVAWAHDIGIEGACEGAMACSTCHVIVDAASFDRLPPPSDEEEDLLDLAWGVHPTSRLGCQITLTDDLDGMVLLLPAETNNQM